MNLIKGRSSDMTFSEGDNSEKEKFFSKIYSFIGNSVVTNDGKISSTRIQGYMTMVLIYAFAIMFIMIEWMNAYHTWPKTYVPSNQSVAIFSMILAHHLGILFNKIRENKFNSPTTPDVPVPPVV